MHSSEVHTYCIANWTLQLVGKEFSDAQRANCEIKMQTKITLLLLVVLLMITMMTMMMSI